MDLNKLDTAKGSDKGVEFALIHPVTGKPMGIFISVYGRDGNAFNKTQSEQNRKRLAQAEKNGRMELLTKEEVEREAVELMAACTFAWRDDEEELKDKILLDGAELACTEENAKSVYSRFKWIREQVDARISNRANFISE